MSLPDGNHESLIRYSQRMLDQLVELKNEPLRPMANEILQEIAKRTSSEFAGLLLVRKGSNDAPSQMSLFAEWSTSGIPSIRDKLQHIQLSFLGNDAKSSLSEGVFVHTALNDAGIACSRLVSGLLRDVKTNSLDMIPVLVNKRLKAILLLAHHGNGEFFSYQDRVLLQQISKVVYLALQTVRHTRRRKRDHRQWKRLADGTCDFALRVDRHLEIVECVAFRQKHLPAAVGLPLNEFTSSGSSVTLLATIETAVKTGTPRTTEIRAIDGDHRLCWYSVRIEPGNGRTRQHATLYLTNNEVERAHEEELRDMKKQLDRATRLSMLGQIATEFAHQLTQPLQSVITKCFTLRSRIQNPEATIEERLDVLNAIESNILHARDMIFSLRDFLKNRSLKIGVVSLKAMIEHAVTMVVPPTEDGKCRITVLDPNNLTDHRDTTHVAVDRVHTTHVFLNLLVNAMEACHSAKTKSPEITITTTLTPNGKAILVEVKDNGPGIPVDKLDSVFDRFFSTKEEGFGIGLSICRDVIERQGGAIHVRNNSDGPGACFDFTLPLVGDEDESEVIEEPWNPDDEDPTDEVSA